MADPPLASHLLASLALQTASADHQVLRAAMSRQNYRRYLERALGVERGIQLMLTNFTFDWDVSSRSKLLPISGDLLALGASVEEILALPTCTAMQHVSDPLEAHCWLLIVERLSTAHWAAYHQLDAVTRELAASYLRAMLSRRGWEQVCGAFDRFSVDDGMVQQLIASTDKAIRAHYDWFAEQQHGASNLVAPAEIVAQPSARLPLGSDNLVAPLDREAILIAPPTKHVDVADDTATPMDSLSGLSIESRVPPDDAVE